MVKILSFEFSRVLNMIYSFSTEQLCILLYVCTIISGESGDNVTILDGNVLMFFPNAAEPGMGQKILDTAENIGRDAAEKVSAKTHIPLWGIVLILIGLLILMFLGCLLCLRRQWRKFRSSEKGKGVVKGLAGNKLFGKFVADKVQPEADQGGLMANIEETAVEEEEEVEKKPAEKIGRLNYKLEYDFNSTNVSVIL